MFNSIYQLNDEVQEAIANESEIISVKKKTRLLNAGEASNTIYFVNKGAARVDDVDKEGIEITSWF